VPCLLGCLAVLSPRAVLFLVWLFGRDYFERAFGSWLLPLLGFFFLPLTTLAFAFGMNSLGTRGEMPPLAWLLVMVALAGDLGLWSGGARGAKAFRGGRGGWRPPN
jgi:hypothetical protein